MMLQSSSGNPCRENTSSGILGRDTGPSAGARSTRAYQGVRSTSDKHPIPLLQTPQKLSFKVSIGRIRHPIFTRTEARETFNFGGRWKYYRFRCGYSIANFHIEHESGLKDMTCARKMPCSHIGGASVTTVTARTRTACSINIRGLLVADADQSLWVWRPSQNARQTTCRKSQGKIVCSVRYFGQVVADA